ncbi:hypothetical protein OQA88_10708 [Cercophora sp. LCS_1]
MTLGQGLREYARLRSSPERKTLSLTVKNDIPIALEIPSFDVVPDEAPTNPKSLLPVLLTHCAFMVSLNPSIPSSTAFYNRCTAEVNAITLFFPDLDSPSLHIVFTAWLGFICAVDDILEKLPLVEQEIALLDCIDLLSTQAKDSHALTPSPSPPASPTLKSTLIQSMTTLLCSHAAHHLTPTTLPAFLSGVVTVFNSHLSEILFLQSRLPRTLPTYLSIRNLTIALSPFFEALKAEYLAPCLVSLQGWNDLQLAVGTAAGLQNDLIGLARDFESGEELNAVVVLMREEGPDQGDREGLVRAVETVRQEHDAAVGRALECAGRVVLAAEEGLEAVMRVVRMVLAVGETHLKWCAGAKRYRVDEAGKPWGLPMRKEKKEVARMVTSAGIFKGLPVYEEVEGLTALVTGATGVSGYSMVRVLAKSGRWKRIICLSSRAPPGNFFDDLGEWRDRVEHLAVDFLSKPEVIAEYLDRIGHVDHVFYFSYMQPAPKGNVLDLWANADELASVNASMFTNFVGALQQTSLRPKRFMLQTGSKHYAFYLGPAALPAFESDPRVLLDRNFYYEQEDTLTAYCQSTGCEWSVARPSYIVGAVRDGTLNHLIGFGIYAAVQAALGRPIVFPGDYRAWDREQVQSSGLLNAYFEEWLVLNPETANEAFNIHDGQSFTWGRLWPELARWYGAEWCPPETDESKYRVMTLPCPTTPRGYGPQATLKSTFSLLEWSLQSEVEETWKKLAAQHDLALDPFDDRYRARIFSFADSAVIGDAAMTISIRKARDFGFFGTVDSYHSIFQTMQDLARLKLIVPPSAEVFLQ